MFSQMPDQYSTFWSIVLPHLPPFRFRTHADPSPPELCVHVYGLSATTPQDSRTLLPLVPNRHSKARWYRPRRSRLFSPAGVFCIIEVCSPVSPEDLGGSGFGFMIDWISISRPASQIPALSTSQKRPRPTQVWRMMLRFFWSNRPLSLLWAIPSRNCGSRGVLSRVS